VYHPSHTPDPPNGRRPYVGHAHFWERALSRGLFIRTAAGAAALAAGAGLRLPRQAGARVLDAWMPSPIPGGTDLRALFGLPSGPIYHLFFPAFGQEVASVGNFQGNLAAAEIQGSGTATNTATGQTSTLTFDADMRFMDGIYVNQAGVAARGTFGFI
jgi:hypothetical protein